METVKGNEKTLGPKFKQVLYIVSHKFLILRAVGNPTDLRNSLPYCTACRIGALQNTTELLWPSGGRWQNAFGINKVRLFPVIFFRDIIKTACPLFSSQDSSIPLLFYQDFNLKSEVNFYLDMLPSIAFKYIIKWSTCIITKYGSMELTLENKSIFFKPVGVFVLHLLSTLFNAIKKIKKINKLN